MNLHPPTSGVTSFVNGRDISGQPLALVCTDGVITALSPEPPTTTVGLRIDLDGRLVCPALVEPHAHLDKAYLAERIDNPTGDLMGAIVAMEAARDTLTHDDIVSRATRGARTLAHHGVSRVRTHVDVTAAGGLTSLLALLEVRDACRDVIDVEVAALVEWPLSGLEGASRRSLARDAIAAGAHVIGGCPHLDENPREAIEFLLSLALEFGIPLDLHADENLRPTSHDLATLADIVIAERIEHPIAASHCVSLSAMEPDEQHRIATRVAEAKIAIIALPLTNLYLQGRSSSSLMPRSIAPLRLLRDAGCTVAAGGDNVQDPFNPLGNGDPFETARLMMLATHELTVDAFDLISTGAARALGRVGELAIGQPANFCAIRATSLREAIAVGPPDRFVVHGGTVIEN